MKNYICNATFMIECRLEDKFLEWLRNRKPALLTGNNPARLSAMRMAGGIDYRHAEAQSVAFQQEFPSIEGAQAWIDGPLAQVAADFERDFGPQAMVFTSIFESLPF